MTAVRGAYAVRWKDISRWDLKTARATLFRLAHPDFRPLGDFAEEATELVRTMDHPEHEWPVYGVNNKNGVFLSHYQRGEKFNAPYKRVRKDWFFHNPTRANVGSLGRVPNVPEDAVTSPEYQVWRLKDGLLPEYVEILIKTPFFIDLIDSHRVGAVKERLFVENLLEIPIPQISKRVQRSIVSAWEKARREVADIRRRIVELGEKIEADFLSELGLARPEHATLPKVFTVRWKDFERWSVTFNQRVQTAVDMSAGRYSLVPLGHCLVFMKYGTSDKANTCRKGIPTLRINNIKGGYIDTSDLKHVDLPPKTKESLLLRNGDILVIRTSGSRDLVGTCAVFHEDGEYVFASYLIRMSVDCSQAHPDYLGFFLNSSLGRQQVDAMSRHIMQNNINTEELRSIRIPLPPLNVQRELVTKVNAERQRIAVWKAKADRKAEQARADIEAMILDINTAGA